MNRLPLEDEAERANVMGELVAAMHIKTLAREICRDRVRDWDEQTSDIKHMDTHGIKSTGYRWCYFTNKKIKCGSDDEKRILKLLPIYRMITELFYE